ncbi:hypothetical protein GCM10010271_68170 [Streptomyces kurssanovii]|nr:hypothetical protein GCM10010271_68170 [Streptomyces kurssanovii]
MDVLRSYFEENPDLFAAVVAALAIVGGLLGSVIGAKIQANGGRDQAAAAREAAKIAAEAQRVAALWTVRQVQIAEFIQGVREVRRISDLFYKQNAVVDGLDVQLSEAQQVVSRKLAEIELIVPFAVVLAAQKVTESLDCHVRLVHVAGPAEYFLQYVQRQVFSEDAAQSALANQAEDALGAMRAAVDPVDPRPGARRFQVAVGALRDATGATVEQAVSVVAFVANGEFPSMVAENSEELALRMSVLIEAARATLKSGDDDVSPVVGEPRRRWWRAA